MPKILVVEDSNALQAYYGQIFRQLAGFQVTFTKDGRQALDQIAEQGTPDIVILDINMPVMDGFEFLEHFKGDRERPPARVVLVTSEGREHERKRGMQAGATAFLTKPFTPEALATLLQGLLAQRVPEDAHM